MPKRRVKQILIAPTHTSGIRVARVVRVVTLALLDGRSRLVRERPTMDIVMCHRLCARVSAAASEQEQE
jgi:hypothetical protein